MSGMRLKPLYPFVSIIILNYNGEKFLKKCLQSVLSSNYENFEIVLVDNGSTDKSLESVRPFDRDPRLKMVCLKENLGFSRGNNTGASVASGKYIVFLNNDTMVDRDWLKELVNVMERNQNVGAAQPKLLFLERQDEVQGAGNFIDTLGFTIPRTRLAEEKGKYDEQVEIAATGAALIIRRNLFDHIRGFEPRFFVYYEDTDLSWRVYLAGKSVLFVPSSIVYHAEGAGLSRVKLALRLNHYVRNQLFTVFKNYSFRNGLASVSFLFLFYVAGTMWFAVRKSSDVSLNVLRALFQFLEILPECWKSHLIVQRQIRKIGDDQLIGRFLKPFNVFLLLKFYKTGMGYVSVDYAGQSSKNPVHG
jgi:GT2 family glycosyltransferase